MGYKRTAKEAGITQRAVAKQRKRGVPEGQIIAGAKAREVARTARKIHVTVSDEEYVQAVRRKAIADAAKVERENAEREKKLVDAKEVETAWHEMISTAKSRLLLIPDELGDRIASESNPIRCRELIREKVFHALEALSDEAA